MMEEEPSSAALQPPLLEVQQLAFEASSHSVKGSVHKVNEDRVEVADLPGHGQVLLVCDGMGGMGRGDEASQLAARELLSRLAHSGVDPLNRMRMAIQETDEVVRRRFAQQRGNKPGTTAALAWVRDGRLFTAWAGDTMVIILRDGQVRQQTRQHRVLEDAIRSGAMSRAQARQSPMHRLLSRSLGGRSEDDEPVEPGMLQPGVLRSGDIVVVATDGVTDSIEPAEMPALIGRLRSADAMARRLVEVAVQRGAEDDVTAAVGRCVAFDTAAHDPASSWTFDPTNPYDDTPDFASDIHSQSEIEADLQRAAAARKAPARAVDPTSLALVGIVVFAGLGGLAMIALALFILFG